MTILKTMVGLNERDRLVNEKTNSEPLKEIEILDYQSNLIRSLN